MRSSHIVKQVSLRRILRDAEAGQITSWDAVAPRLRAAGYDVEDGPLGVTVAAEGLGPVGISDATDWRDLLVALAGATCEAVARAMLYRKGDDA